MRDQYYAHIFSRHFVQIDGIWTVYSRKPKLEIIYSAHKIICENEDGSYEYIKNRDGTGVKILDVEEEKEMVFIMLTAEKG